MDRNTFTIEQINSFSANEFKRIFGGVFEHSPWIAEATCPKQPFENFEDLHEAFCQTVSNSSAEQQLALIRAHPDLVGRAALAGTLTPASTQEQNGAGLNNLTASEISLFQKYNFEYQEKFGFPFIICARLNKKSSILAGFECRLKNSRETEVQAAIKEIFKIAEFRLSDLMHA